MRQYILTFFAVLGFGCGLIQAQVKIGYTNVELILQYMPETQVIEKELATLEKKLTEQLEVKQKYYQQKLLEFMQAQKEGKITPEIEKIAIAELQKLETEIQKAIDAAEEKLMRRRMEMLKPLQDRMQSAIDAVAKEGGYTYILNQAVGEGIPSILYGAEKFNVTEQIARKLNIKVD